MKKGRVYLKLALASLIAKRIISNNITSITRSFKLTRDEVFYFDYKIAFLENSDKQIKVEFSWNNSLNYDYKPLNISSYEIPYEVPKSLKLDINVEPHVLGSSLSATGMFWFSKMMYFDSADNNKYILFGDINRYKASMETINPKNLYKLMFKKNSKYNCDYFYYVTEMNLSIFACKTSNERWSLLLRCSDESCNDRQHILKVSENRRDKQAGIKIKRMPGYSRKSITLLVYFKDDLLLETINIDNTGSYTSDIHILKNKINNIFYFSGQLIVFKCTTPTPGVYEYFYRIHDFGTRYDFTSWQPMQNYGKFINSYSAMETSDLMIEFYDSSFNIVALRYNRVGERFMIVSSIDMKNDKIFKNNTRTHIFEISEYQFIINKNEEEETVYYSLGYKGQNLLLKDTDKNFYFSDLFSKISGIDEIASVHYNVTNTSQSLLKTIKFNRPVLKIRGSSWKEIKRIRILEKMIGLDTKEEKHKSFFYNGADKLEGNVTINVEGNHFMRIDLTLSDEEIGAVWWTKKVANVNGEATYMLKSSSFSNLIIRAHKLVRGSLLAVTKFKGREENQEHSFENQINPLFAYYNLEEIDQYKLQLMEGKNLMGFSHRGRESEKFVIFSHNPHDFNTTGYEIENKNVKKVYNRSLLVDAQRYYIFNETLIIIQGENNLWFMDITNPNENKIKEMMFERGHCGDFMLMRHSKLDVSFWCASKNKLQAYYARQLLSGKVGLSKIPVETQRNFPFEEMNFEYNGFFQDYFYCIDKNFTMHIFKVDAKIYVNVILVKSIELKMKRKDRINQILDFKFVEDKMVIYTDERIGWDRRIALHFYHFESSIEVVHLRTIELDYGFSPDLEETQLFRYQSLRTNVYREKYLYLPMLAIKVKYNLEYDNIILINPQLEYLQSLPAVVFSMGSKVKINVGTMITTSPEILSLSLLVAYRPIISDWDDSMRSIINVSIIEPEELKIRLFKTNSTNSTDIFEVYSDYKIIKAKEIYFEQFNSSNPYLREKDLKLVINYTEDKTSNDSLNLVRFVNSTATLDLNNYNYSNFISEHKKIEHKISVFNLLKGHAFRFELKTESELEFISKVIHLENLIEAPTKPLPEDFSELRKLKINQTCSKPLRIEVNSLFRNDPGFKNRSFIMPDDKLLADAGLPVIEEFQIWICSSDKMPILNVRRVWRNLTLQTQTLTDKIKKIFVINFGDITLEYFNHILSVNVRSSSDNRIIYNDVYFLDLFTSINQTAIGLTIVNKKTNPGTGNKLLTNEQKIKIKEIILTIEENCFDHDHYESTKEERALRIAKCKLKFLGYLEYKVHMAHLKKENFRLDQSDFLIRTNVSIKNVTGSNGTTYLNRTMDMKFVIFGLKKNVFREYVVEMLIDEIHIDFRDPKNITKMIDDNAKYVNFRINQKFADENDITIYDDIDYKIVNKFKKDVWLTFENPSGNNILVRYPPSILEEGKPLTEKNAHSDTIPFAWRIDNPFFSKTSGTTIASKFRDWLYVLPKVIGKSSHFTIYIIPEEDIIRYNNKTTQQVAQKLFNQPIYASSIFVSENVVDYTIKNLDFSPQLSSNKIWNEVKKSIEFEKKEFGKKDPHDKTMVYKKPPRDLIPTKFIMELKHSNGSSTRMIISRELTLQIDNAFLTSSYVELIAFSKPCYVNISNPNQRNYFSKQKISIKPYDRMTEKKYIILLHLVVIVGSSLLTILCIWRALSVQESEYDAKVAQEDKMKKKVEELKLVAMHLKDIWKQDLEKAERERERIMREREKRKNTLLLGDLIVSDGSDTSEEFDLTTGEKIDKDKTFRPNITKSVVMNQLQQIKEEESDLKKKYEDKKKELAISQIRSVIMESEDEDDSKDLLEDKSSSSSNDDDSDSDY